MAPVTRVVELYRPETTEGNTAGVESDGDLTKCNLVATTTANTDMVGTNNAALASVATEARLAELDTANLPADVAAIPTTMVGTDNAALASVATEARLAELDAANLPADVAALNDVSVADILTTQLTESYAALGAVPTLAQAIQMTLSHLQEAGIAANTKTTKKVDGSTTAMTFTLDDGDNPATVTRAS
jgi:hypothetical protein